LAGEFAACGTVVVGISADSVAAQKKFEEKQALTVPLLSDPEKKVLEAYGLHGEKKLYGITRMGILRSTVVIGLDGKVEKIFRNVKAKGHAEKVLEFVRGG